MYMTSSEEKILEEAQYIVDNNATIRATAKHFDTPKSTVYHNVTHHLCYISPTLAKKVREVLAKNTEERSIRGGIATKNKYLLLKQSK